MSQNNVKNIKLDFDANERKIKFQFGVNSVKFGNVISTSSGTTDHTRLSNRDLPEQHPISAITNLENELSGKQDTLIAGENINIENNVISASASGGGGVTSYNDLTDIPTFNGQPLVGNFNSETTSGSKLLLAIVGSVDGNTFNPVFIQDIFTGMEYTPMFPDNFFGANFTGKELYEDDIVIGMIVSDVSNSNSVFIAIGVVTI